MKSRAEIVSFGLFIVVALAAMFYVLRGRGHDNIALVLGLAAVIAVRAGMFLYNLKRQRDQVEGRKPKPEVKLDLK
jgi:cytochrome bd-type quinol oxidase subunit 1